MTVFDWMLINVTVMGFIDGFLLATAIFLAVRLRKGRKIADSERENKTTPNQKI